MNNGVFIPIEIIRREYLSKLLLAVELLKKGMPVIIGHKNSVINLALKTKEPGILFYKAVMYGQKEKTFKILKEKNFGIVSQDEEAGIVYDDFEDFYEFRVSLKLINQLDLFFTWGEDDYNYLTKKFSKEKVKNYGALRSCFWGDLGRKFHQSNSENLKKKFGNYILIVSNFPTYNSFLEKSDLKKLQSGFRGFDINKPNQLYENEKKIFNQYVKLAKLLSKELNKTVIIRPHPGESLQGWKDSVKGINNVFVEKNGELLSWILASDCIIQNNCTSAIEASTLNIPVLTYADDKEDLTLLSEGNENIPNKLSLNILGEDQFKETLKNINSLWHEDINKIQRETLLNRKLKDYGTTKSAENIAQKIIEYTGKPNSKGNETLGKDSVLYDIYDLYRSFKYRTKLPGYIMDFNKRETISHSMIQKDITHLLSILKIEKKVKLKRVGRSAFYLYPLK